MSPEELQLIEAAREVIEKHTDADEHGDGFHTMGCAVLDEQGRVHVGVNFYHFTGGPCAELVALGAARASGARNPQLIVAVGNAGRGVKAPCGRCRQIMSDNYPQIRVITPTSQGVKSMEIQELLPYGFDWNAAQSS
ncbi:cytidine deaminase [Glutamicibacter uratoxydans]|uniref:Cytidine deaminase n=1 Tax=Glutamicibacter uratoxydans TaxID=43667 RepID=A0A4Y4DQQ7_GLUUR|nr:cytidine deaminase [Glutamicibacter uratoxydans]GED06947.1 cytidine deaminase [Glutamicibacter uratoxydans]